MRSENFVAFFTVSGFFIGLIFSILKYDDVLDLFLYTLAITLFFHMFIHVVLALFIKADDSFHISFDKAEYENIVNAQITLLKERENEITALLKSINNKNEYEKEGKKANVHH